MERDKKNILWPAIWIIARKDAERIIENYDYTTWSMKMCVLLPFYIKKKTENLFNEEIREKNNDERFDMRNKKKLSFSHQIYTRNTLLISQVSL